MKFGEIVWTEVKIVTWKGGGGISKWLKMVKNEQFSYRQLLEAKVVIPNLQ